MCKNVCVYCGLVGLWDPSWTRGNGRSTVHWPDRSSWNRPAAHKPVSSENLIYHHSNHRTTLRFLLQPTGLMHSCKLLCDWHLALPSFSASTWITVELCPGSCRRPVLKDAPSWLTRPRPSTAGCCQTMSKSGRSYRLVCKIIQIIYCIWGLITLTSAQGDLPG